MQIQLKNQLVDVVKCKKCDYNMVNLDANQLAIGDFLNLKLAKVRISNPETEESICIDCELQTFKKKLNDWMNRDNDDNDDDSSFFHSSGISLGSPSFGGFGGFSGGGFGGAGATRGF